MRIACSLNPGWYRATCRPLLERLGFQFGPANEWGNAAAVGTTGWCHMDTLAEVIALGECLGDMPIVVTKERYRDGELLPREAQQALLVFGYQR